MILPPIIVFFRKRRFIRIFPSLKNQPYRRPFKEMPDISKMLIHSAKQRNNHVVKRLFPVTAAIE
jgi:hypothetical protein